ncbi:bifunctional nuclease family protein [Labilibaculum sp. DW002]|uniref:Bifunctional nuclease family protein n=1 Tax=Paralabilibaculum antarcticum TaxID=2912572 RepID=A0ABT5VU56_9BACT|nr:bifunctional nuclease domain-containing protein [Labilibaculum sp. DW002]MDE5418332.1 bifunctional nuclease family protein [Labilibaculum sp. DW002]
MGKIKLNVLGLSYSQTQTGAYALVLSEEDGDRRIPIIIGGVEAQSIAIQLEELAPPRPLTHDLFKSFAEAFTVNVVEVNIYRLEEGIFYSELICEKGANRIRIDSRTSDAVAIALRFKCPIYTTDEIIEKAGIVLSIEGESQEPSIAAPKESESVMPSTSAGNQFSDYSLAQLTGMLDDAIKDEDYEKASLLRDEIGRRGEKS